MHMMGRYEAATENATILTISVFPSVSISFIKTCKDLTRKVYFWSSILSIKGSRDFEKLLQSNLFDEENKAQRDKKLCPWSHS